MPATNGPLQSTGSPSCSKSKLEDIIFIPVFVTTGIIFWPSLTAFSWLPKTFGIDAPVISASKIPVSYPLLLAKTDNIDVTIVFPTPPFPLTTPITFPILEYSLAGASKLLSLQSALHELQLLLHSLSIF